MGSCIKIMGIIAAVVQGICILFAAVTAGVEGAILLIICAFAVILNTLIIVAIGNILETSDSLRSAVSTLLYKVEKLEKQQESTTPRGGSIPVASSVRAVDYQNLPAWQRVEMEREQRQKAQDQQ